MNERISEPKAVSAAVILSFPKKRGRPKKNYSGSDTGTPELVMKRALGETIEALDLCFERKLITQQQHWCGIHLRWLYTLRHGAPGVRALDPTHLGGCEIKIDDPQWRIAREIEYQEAVNLLAQSKYALIVLNICVYNERPDFLSAQKNRRWEENNASNTSLNGLRDGLERLVCHWKRGNKKP